MSNFIPGLELSKLFYLEAVKPILDADFSGLRCSATLGGGSEVLGFDAKMSTDHDWGTRLMLFLEESDFAARRDETDKTLRYKLPYKFRGYSINFGLPDSNDNGTQLLALFW